LLQRIEHYEWRDRHQSFMHGRCCVGVSLRRHHRLAQCAKAHREIGEEGIGSAFCEATIDFDGLLRRGQGLLAAAEAGETEMTRGPPGKGASQVAFALNLNESCRSAGIGVTPP
jgi:hypothetical protein